MILPQLFSGLQRMNSDAVCLLLEGRPEEALETFSRCGAAVKTVLMSHVNVGDASNTPIFSKSDNSLSLYEVSLNEVIYPIDTSERMSPENCFKLHRYVYMIDGESQSPTVSSLRVLLATVLYNMAAISHESVQDGLHCQILDKARSFYELALAILHIDRETNLSPAIDTMPLTLALTNNLGHIYAIFFNRDGALFCRDRLDFLLSSVDQNKIETGEYSFFQSTSMAQNYMSKAPAA